MADRQMEFEAVVKIEGVNPYVDVPDKAAAALLPGKGRVLVRVRGIGASPSRGRPGGRAATDAPQLVRMGRLTEDGWFRTSLVSRRDRPPRLFLDRWMRDSAGAKVGHKVHVVVREDRGPRELPLPGALQDALAADDGARAAWEELPSSRRKSILAYLNSLKSDAAVKRTVDKVLRELRDAGRA